MSVLYTILISSLGIAFLLIAIGVVLLIFLVRATVNRNSENANSSSLPKKSDDGEGLLFIGTGLGGDTPHGGAPHDHHSHPGGHDGGGHDAGEHH
jgi:hypothetical protein